MLPRQNMLVVQYEDVVKDPIGQVKRMTDFLQVEVPESMWNCTREKLGQMTRNKHHQRYYAVINNSTKKRLQSWRKTIYNKWNIPVHDL